MANVVEVCNNNIFHNRIVEESTSTNIISNVHKNKGNINNWWSGAYFDKSECIFHVYISGLVYQYHVIPEQISKYNKAYFSSTLNLIDI